MLKGLRSPGLRLKHFICSHWLSGGSFQRLFVPAVMKDLYRWRLENLVTAESWSVKRDLVNLVPTLSFYAIGQRLRRKAYVISSYTTKKERPLLRLFSNSIGLCLAHLSSHKAHTYGLVQQLMSTVNKAQSHFLRLQHTQQWNLQRKVIDQFDWIFAEWLAFK